jgi:hypothetical protein
VSTFLRSSIALSLLTPMVALSACGGTQSSNSGDARAPRANGYAACVVADVSGSTQKARGYYVDAFKKFAKDAGTGGSGQICLVVASGDPQGEGAPRVAYVGPDPSHRDNPVYAPGEIARAVETATGQFAALMAHPPVSAHGSAIVESAAVVAPNLHRGDRLLMTTDGFQSSDLIGDFHHADLSDAGISKLLNKVARARLLPDLSGVTVEMPLLLFHPGGTSFSQVKQSKIRSFWIAWARRTHAKLDLTPVQ